MPDHHSLNTTIPCQSGNIEGRIHYKEENKEQPGVILCPPHPLLAGNMDNNVIQCLAETLAQNFTVLSFNYRNVGKSFKPEGNLPLFEYWDQLDQKSDFTWIIRDTKEILDWSKRFFTNFHLVGYSFGAFIGLATQHQSMLSYTAIAPPLAEHDFKELNKLDCPTLLIFAEQDHLLLINKEELPEDAIVSEITGSDHFFLQKEQKVCEQVQAFLVK